MAKTSLSFCRSFIDHIHRSISDYNYREDSNFKHRLVALRWKLHYGRLATQESIFYLNGQHSRQSAGAFGKVALSKIQKSVFPYEFRSCSPCAASTPTRRTVEILGLAFPASTRYIARARISGIYKVARARIFCSRPDHYIL